MNSMTKPDIQVQAEGVYRITGELLMATVPALVQRASEVLGAAASSEVTIDLSGVSRADSAALALLLELQRIARRAALTMHFRGLPDQLLQIAGLSELDEILPISA